MQRVAARVALVACVAMLAGITQLVGGLASNAAPAAPAQADSSGGAGASSSPSESPSGSPTESPAASPTACTSPSPSPSSSHSASSSPSASPIRSARSVTLFASKGEVTSGDEVDFSGQIFSTNSSCDGLEEFVRLRRRLAGDDQYENFKSTLTDANGRFDFKGVQVVFNSEYVALAPAHDDCADGTSDPVSVQARARVTIKANDETPARGSEIRLTGDVSPNQANSKVRLQQHRGGGWETVAGARLSKSSHYVFDFEAVGPKTQRYRVHWTGSKENEPGTSPEIKLRLHK